WDAADVEACAAEHAALVDASHAQAQLSGADRRVVAAGSTADHHHIIIRHSSSLFRTRTRAGLCPRTRWVAILGTRPRKRPVLFRAFRESHLRTSCFLGGGRNRAPGEPWNS